MVWKVPQSRLLESCPLPFPSTAGTPDVCLELGPYLCDSCHEKKSQWVSERKTAVMCSYVIVMTVEPRTLGQNKNKWAGGDGSNTQTSPGSPRLHTALLPEAV